MNAIVMMTIKIIVATWVFMGQDLAWHNYARVRQRQNDCYNWLNNDMSRIMSRSIDPRNIEVVDDEYAEVLRAKTPGERISMIADANETARLLAAAGIRYCHPEWIDDQVRREVARRMLGAAN
jgi:hypothetical protein